METSACKKKCIRELNERIANVNELLIAMNKWSEQFNEISKDVVEMILSLQEDIKEFNDQEKMHKYAENDDNSDEDDDLEENDEEIHENSWINSWVDAVESCPEDRDICLIDCDIKELGGCVPAVFYSKDKTFIFEGMSIPYKSVKKWAMIYRKGKIHDCSVINVIINN